MDWSFVTLTCSLRQIIMLISPHPSPLPLGEETSRNPDSTLKEVYHGKNRN